MNVDLKETINPFILLSLIFAISFMAGITGLDLLIYSFVVFILFSIINNIALVLLKIVRKRLYLFFYGVMAFSLIFLIPLFYLIDVRDPILTSFFILGITDFIIQSYYNILPRKDGKEIINAWKDKLVKSERCWFHPISLQKYTFKDFTITIIDSEAINPTNLHVMHLRPLKYEKIPKHIYKHQYGKPSYLFHIYLGEKDEKDDRFNDYGNKTIKSLKINPELMNKLKGIDKEISKHIITAYNQGSSILDVKKSNAFVRNETAYRKGGHDLKIFIEKQFVGKNPEKVYDFLKKCNKFFNLKSK